MMRHLFATSGLARWLAGALALVAATSGASAGPSLVADLSTGEVIVQDHATQPWYPASLTKLMTVYVALKAVRDGRVTMDTPFVMSARAAKEPPSKMGFAPGTEVTLENALKMLMVKSANDLAVMIAEGVSGSVEDFADEMNRAAASLGMRQSHFVNPNGLFDPNHYSSARDLAVLARALYMEFPEQSDLYGIGALRLGDKIIPTHNGLIGRYPGADGMKTGFVCPSGFNVVGTASRGGRRLVVVVMGSPNAKSRTLKAASLFDAGFASSTPPRAATLAMLPDQPGTPPNIRPQICGKHKKNLQEDDLAVVPQQGDSRQLVLGPRPTFEPIDVFVGRKPGWNGPVAMARVTAPPPAAAPVAGASAFAATGAIGATASRAIAVKSLPQKAVVKKASARHASEVSKAHGKALKKTPEHKAAAKKPEPVHKKAEAKKAETKKGAATKSEPKKAAPAKTASKSKDRTQ